MLLLICIKRFKNLNLFEIFILLSNLFATEYHWEMTDRWCNYISLSLGGGGETNPKQKKTVQNKTGKSSKTNYALFWRLGRGRKTRQSDEDYAVTRVRSNV